MYLSLDPKRTENDIKKKMAENLLKIDLLDKVITGATLSKDYKQITQRLCNNIEASTSLEKRMNSFYLRCYIPREKRIWRASEPDSNDMRTYEYLENDTESIFFDSIAELIINSTARIEGMTEENKKLSQELDNLPALMLEASELETQYKEFEKKLSYAFKRSIKFID